MSSDQSKASARERAPVAGGGSAGRSRRPALEPESELVRLQRSAGNQAVAAMLGAPGQPLDPSTRTEMEARLGGDFGDVRVHADKGAADLAAEAHAKALTLGREVVFAQGRYQPGSVQGRRLLAHELAHVMQQERGRVALGPEAPRSSRLDVAEREAASAGEAIATGHRAPVSAQAGPRIQKADDAAPEAKDEGPTYKVVENGASPAAGSAAKDRMPQILAGLQIGSLAGEKKVTVELHIIPAGKKLTDLAPWAQLKGKRLPDGRSYDDLRQAGGEQTGSTITFAVGEEELVPGAAPKKKESGVGGVVGGIIGGLVGAAGGALAGAAIGSAAGGLGALIGGIIGGIAGLIGGAKGGAALGEWIGRGKEKATSKVALTGSATHPLLKDFSAKFPEAAKLVLGNMEGMKLVGEAETAGVLFGGFAEDGPASAIGRAYTSGKSIYVPRTVTDPVLAMHNFLFELNNALREPKFAALSLEAQKGSTGTLTARDYAYKMVEQEVEGMLRLGEIWFKSKPTLPDGEKLNKYDIQFYQQEYTAVKEGKKTKDDIVREVLNRVYETGNVRGKTTEQYYMEYYTRLSGGR